MEMQEVQDNMFLPLPGIPPILITRTEGVYLYDSSGARFIDASGGPMAVTIGLGRKEVAEAAKKSIEQVSYVLPIFASEARIEPTKRIKNRLPAELNEVYYCSGGSEANEAAVKFARQYHVLAGRESRYKVVSRNLSYHGMTLLTLSIGDVKMRQRDFLPMLWKNPRVEPHYCYRCPYGKEYPGCDIDCALDLEKKILEEGPETVSAFIAEPVVASAGDRAHPRSTSPSSAKRATSTMCCSSSTRWSQDSGGPGRTWGWITLAWFRTLPPLPRAPVAHMHPWQEWRCGGISQISSSRRGRSFSISIPFPPILCPARWRTRCSGLSTRRV